MMYGNGMMMGGPGYLGFLIGVVILADLILLGVWLWKKINGHQ